MKIQKYFPTTIVVLLFLSACLPERGPTLFSIGPVNIKILHLLILYVGIVNWRKLKLFYEIRPLFFQLTFFAAWSIVLLFTGIHFDPIILNYLLGAITLVVLGTGLLGKQKIVIDGLQIGAFVVLAFTIVAVFMNFGEYQSALSQGLDKGWRPLTAGYFFSGGINIVASWIALFSAFYFRSPKLLLVYVIGAGFIQWYFMSRSGSIALAAVLVLAVWKNFSVIKSRLSSKVLIISAAVLTTSFAVIIGFSGLGARFALIGNEPGSEGRIALWESSVNAIKQKLLFGWGLGNEYQILKSFGHLGGEGNLHNSILTGLLAAGAIGLIVFIWTTLLTIYRIRNWAEPFAFFTGYVLISLIEFRGAEIVMLVPFALLIGAWRSASNNESLTKLS